MLPPAVDTDLATSSELTLEVHAERLIVSKRRVADQVVRVATETQTRDIVVEETVTHEDVVVEHVPTGRYVDATPPIRQEGDTTIVPVVEEHVVVTRRLFLREEVHLRRVKTQMPHSEVATIREQQVVVTRKPAELAQPIPLAGAKSDFALASSGTSTPMTDETIVAVYDTPAHAQLAVADIEAAGVPSSAISLHRTGATTTGTATTGAVEEPGFWSRLFGGETEYDNTVYDRSVQSGSTVVSVKVPEAHVAQVTQILESHSPIDIDERATSYGLSSASTATGATMGAATMGDASVAPAAYAGQTAVGAAEGGTIQLAEERLAVGKRLVNRGGTRIRRYVVETPVEESVTLHSERVVLDRHPVTDGRPLQDASFTDKAIEMTETAEEVVVAKTAQVVEEVSLRKEAVDRVETVRDTVRKEEVEIVQIPGEATTFTSGTTVSGTAPKI